MSRSIDHLVLPVTDIEEARVRFETLGFTVAPTGRHPFGTENCCIFFEDNTFLEPLGVAHRETCERHARRGNTFVRNDLSFRFRCANEGLSHLVIKSDDAAADNTFYRHEGVSGGNMVRFSRGFNTPSGEAAKASFSLAFAQDMRSPDAGFFSCEVVSAPDVDRSALKRHKNGIVGLSEIVLSETNPTDFQYFFQTYLEQREMDADSFGMSFQAQKCKVRVMSPVGLKTHFGVDVGRRERGLRFELFVLGTQNLSQTKVQLSASNVSFMEHNNRIVIHPAPGQGVPILIEEI